MRGALLAMEVVVGGIVSRHGCCDEFLRVGDDLGFTRCWVHVVVFKRGVVGVQEPLRAVSKAFERVMTLRHRARV